MVLKAVEESEGVIERIGLDCVVVAKCVGDNLIVKCKVKSVRKLKSDGLKAGAVLKYTSRVPKIVVGDSDMGLKYAKNVLDRMEIVKGGGDGEEHENDEWQLAVGEVNII